MARITQSARITGPVHYVTEGDKAREIPLGPCLIEHTEGNQVVIVWGAKGQNCAALDVSVINSAAKRGHLVLLD